MARILVVDDSALSRKSLKEILEHAGHEIVGEAGDGQDALEKYKSLKPDLVTMDITMPRVSGIEGLKSIVAADEEARVVMISALGQGAKILEALQNGARHYLTKPFEADKVLDAVAEVLAA
ncbi:response regulator [Desulfovibrio sulfodismutans]|uniref:Response regulator n=1 Tax=Desulfolutivibrio sulfodismutans TaxID=63561 RepID=A0A7K3NNR4_9BACT|nr:response regulator [Desulfolutivibrio sulfodismutans]NDY57473.1 response regulator [Desulfolutivibrio sulfodismutans]QLA14309.1 response regulator [Desulfolutivibrio sulfodismutans DSM 3696]